MTSERFAQEIVALTDTLYRVSYSILRQRCDREDAVQNCLEKAWKKRKSLRDERYLKTWLVRILINECYDIHRRRQRAARRADAPAGGGTHTPRPSLHGGLVHSGNRLGAAPCARDGQNPHAARPDDAETTAV